ncbi:threonyl-tRNA synthetase [Saprolegnia diclina VS20]|uniref:Probable threonine--tRNA ligase, cytoplasmic n=1 Tax=Saprolegnia diclina (strain VS20) TaxID=1156394 RepID=T0QCT8_SAPDV|nr:threonyl-tRNA synthetase [Saprolegnia diclina VS20]EQC31365.1 threonyl-tRNA synthetase [Saprolegnia diclina VS20]|eukprot:XP_008615206.1 threonyl-tRNA synthetase [Saprolegnia diclina VS20]
MADAAAAKLQEATIADKADPKRQQTRLTKASGPSIAADANKIGGAFTLEPNPAFIQRRIAVYDRVMAAQKELLAAQPRKPIKITLPDGTVKEGVSWETTPLDIAKGISQGLADSVVVAKVKYAGSPNDPLKVTAADVDGNESQSADSCCCSGGDLKEELWDVFRPLIGDCKLQLLKFEDEEGRMVFWHSSAHILGEGLELMKGCHLTIGPPVEGGFYYDSYMGENTIAEGELKDIEKRATAVVKEKQAFERIVLTKEEALEMFADNIFKTQIISTKIPDGGRTTAYRCGPLIDLCRGPHVPHTGKIKAFAVTRTSSTYWLGKTTNDTLQRVYGISFPDTKQMKEWKHFQEEAAKRDHRKLGLQEELYFFHQLSPGCCFWLPHGARIYMKLLEYIRSEYRKRGYHEVITPNVFNMDLWHTSGHAQHYKDNMFVFNVEGQEFAMKPMNCPSHCLMFDHRLRSYRELPLRLADCGVLHRNELSGALTGLTRVRRFQQDDAHIFCREDQITTEVLSYLNFMKDVYDVFGLSCKLKLSTKPEKALGSAELWEKAEGALASAMDTFIGAGNWSVDPGDGAFYGPKIDITVTDALNRKHQCATVQLDFQLPIRFDLKYRSDGGTDGSEQFARPVMIHRAIYGSIERFCAIITEHFAAKFPFWLSPRQVLIVSVGAAYNDYAHVVKEELFCAGYHVDVDDSSKTLNKKIREGQMAHYNFICVVGADEEAKHAVNIRTRDNKIHGTKTVADTIAMFDELVRTKARDEEVEEPKKESPKAKKN